MKPPCMKDGVPCDKRRPGCQGRCEKMEPFMEERKRIREQREAEMKRDAYKADAVARMKRRRK